MLADQTVEAHHHALEAGCSSGVVALYEVAEDRRSRQTMKENDLLHHEGAPEDRLIEIMGPGRVGLIAQLGCEGDVGLSGRKAGWGVELRIGPALGPFLHEEMVDLVRRDDVSNGSDRLDGAFEVRRECNGRPDPGALI